MARRKETILTKSGGTYKGAGQDILKSACSSHREEHLPRVDKDSLSFLFILTVSTWQDMPELVM